jgi:hypothetical protein
MDMDKKSLSDGRSVAEFAVECQGENLAQDVGDCRLLWMRASHLLWSP